MIVCRLPSVKRTKNTIISPTFSLSDNYMKMIFYILISIFTLTTPTVFGQLIPYGLQLDKVQKEILLRTSAFDSLVFVNKASYWTVDRQIKGYGFRGKEIYKMTSTFKQNTTSFYDITIDQIKKSKLSVASKIDAIKLINYSSIETVSSDSLNLKSRTNTYIDISDQPEWTFLSIKKSIFVLIQSYAPEIYQKISPTKERKLFMTTLTQLDELLK